MPEITLQKVVAIVNNELWDNDFQSWLHIKVTPEHLKLAYQATPQINQIRLSGSDPCSFSKLPS